MRLNGDGADARFLQSLRDEEVVARKLVEVAPIAVRFGWVLADHERTYAFAGVRREGIASLENDGTRRERVDVRRHGLRVSGVAQICTQRVDGDENDGEPFGQKVPTGRRGARGARRLD